jgi:hypothetical protein
MRTLAISSFGVALALAAVSAAPAFPQAVTRVVTNTADSGPGSLREALAAAGNGETVDATGVGGTIALTSGPLQVTSSVTIRGPGAVVLRVSGGNASRVLEISGADVTIHGLGITEGASSAGGAGIRISSPSGSSVQLDDCAVSSCATTDHGGGIYNASGVTLVIEGCLLDENRADRSGGAIFNDAGTVICARSTLRANQADLGGALFNDGANGPAIVQLERSTCSANSANYGGAIYSRGAPSAATVIAASSTFSGNSAGDGSAIASDGAWSGFAEVELNACTFADNPTGGGVIANEGRFGGSAELDIANSIFTNEGLEASFVNRDGAVRSFGFNMSRDDAGGLLNHATDRVSTNPLLGPLQDHGGPTLTHAPLPGSPAIDAGSLSAFGTALEVDQRGVLRRYDDPTITNAQGSDGTDIGAFEAVPSAPISKLQAKVNFTKLDGDSCSFSASLDLGGGFDPAGQQLRVDFAGAAFWMTLDEKGRGASPKGETPAARAKLAFQKRSGLWTLSATLKQGSWPDAWSARGLVNEDIPKPGHAVMLPVIVQLGERCWVSEVSVSYTAKAGKSGAAK